MVERGTPTKSSISPSILECEETWPKPNPDLAMFVRILVYLVIHGSGQVSLEHLLLSWYPTLSLSQVKVIFGSRPGFERTGDAVSQTMEDPLRL